MLVWGMPEFAVVQDQEMGQSAVVRRGRLIGWVLLGWCLEILGFQKSMIEEDALNIYTDGSCLPSPRRGGVGVHFVTVNEAGEEVIEDLVTPGYRGETNNMMELEAVIDALEEVIRRSLSPSIHRVIVNTDSMYVCENYNRALFQWPKTKWTRSNGQPVLNVDLWKKLTKLGKKIQSSRLRLKIRWVKGHAKDPHNKAADKLAKQSARDALLSPRPVVKVRRKLTSKSLEIGSVGMHGQRVTIRVVTDEYLRSHRLNRYRYEVMSPNSKFFGNVDIAYSELLLSAGHTYEITLNKNQSNPRIVRLVREVVPDPDTAGGE